MCPIAWPLLAIVLAACPAGAMAQPADARALIASQTEAMRALAMLDGAWRGPVSIRQASAAR